MGVCRNQQLHINFINVLLSYQYSVSLLFKINQSINQSQNRYKQKGEAAVEAQNLFFNLTYVEDLTVDTSLDEGLRANLLMQVAQYGQTPSQLLTTPHPARSSRQEVATSQLEGIPVSLLAEGVIPQKVLRTKHKTAVAALLFQGDHLFVLDSVGRCSIHTVQSTFDTSTGLPLEVTVSEKHTKRTVSGVTVCYTIYRSI